ncbi:MAG TPA: MarR family transcriptional regulator [Kribbella sp.]|jgi:hypothetical protein
MTPAGQEPIKSTIVEIVQFVLLACTWWLTEQGHTPNQLDLAEQAGTDIKMTSQVLKTLENKGLLTRRPPNSPTDDLPRPSRGRSAHVVSFVHKGFPERGIYAELPVGSVGADQRLYRRLQSLLRQPQGNRPQVAGPGADVTAPAA